MIKSKVCSTLFPAACASDAFADRPIYFLPTLAEILILGVIHTRKRMRS